MKKIIILLLLSIIAFVFMFNNIGGNFNKDYYISQKTLDIASPLNVTIDTEFLRKLPAYE